MKRHNRRATLIVAMISIFASVAACGGGSGGSDDSGSKKETITFAAQGAATGDNFKTAIKAFEKANPGITVTFVEGTQQALFAKVLAGKQSGNASIDVLYSNDAADAQGRAQDLFQPLDKKYLTNLDQTQEGTLPSDNMGPFVYKTLQVMVYNTDLLKKAGVGAPTSWADMWNPAYTKCGLVLAEPHGAAKEWNMMNYVASGGDLYDIDATLAKLKAVNDRKQLTAIVSSAADVTDAVASGKACIGSVNQGKVLSSIDDGAPIDFTIPKEGTAFLTDSLQLIKGTKHAVAAQKLINWMLDQPAQELFYSKGGYTPVNLNVKPATSGSAARIILPSKLGDTKVLEPEPAKSDLDAWLKKFQTTIEK